MNKWHGKDIDWGMNYGLGVLSKFPIERTKRIILPNVAKEKKCGFLHLVFKTEKGNFDVLNVHFENTDVGAKEQLRKTLLWCNKRRIKPIIGGDFNIKNTNDIKSLADKKYSISYYLKKYKSFQPSIHSYNQIPITLDYIIAHKKKFNINNIRCIHNNISDHDPVLATIKIKQLS